MLITFEQVGILFLFATVGYLLSKTKLVQPAHSKILSTLLVYIFLPCNIFKTYTANFNLTYLTQKYDFVLISLVIIGVLMLLSLFIPKLLTKNKYDQAVYAYSLLIPNYGYMGYALSESLLGESGKLNFMVFAIPFSLYIYTIGYCKLTKVGISLKKLLNPVIIATLLGIIAGLVELPLPGIAISALEKASACMAPTSMLLAGITVSQYQFKSLLLKPASYVVTLLRLVGIPVTIGLLLSLFGVRKEIIQVAVLLTALPCGLNTIVFPKLVGENCEIGASLAMVSNIIACISIPIVFSIFVL